MTRPLVIVSNRLPFRAVRSGRSLTLTRSPGGLVSALDPALRAAGGTWVGWSGLSGEDLSGGGRMSLPHEPRIRYVDVPLSARDVAMYYHGFSNRTLWPLFHYFVGRTEIDTGTWRAYDRVNQRFAEVTAETVGSRKALIWVQDYQLLRAPHYLRRLTPDAAIALFLHVPFPAADVFRILPWGRDLLRGMLSADFVGFHIESYASHFLDCAEQLLGCTVDRDAGTVRFDGRLLGVGVAPVSIDVDEADRLSAAAAVARPGPRPEGALRQILGVDRLDYTKGIVQRLLAIERLLERYPEYRTRIQFTQVLVPSREHVREYRELKREIDETVGRINGRFSDGGWTPISYRARSLSRDALFATYRGAEVALVTPLRDGMNLVAKEYVMAQGDGDGVLVLSELAGVADEFQEAVTVTPFDADAIAEALHRALSMPLDERRARLTALQSRVRAHDVHAWVASFLDGAERATKRGLAVRESADDDVRRQLTPWLVKRRNVALLLDYDGTLAPIVENPDNAAISAAMRSALEQARRNPNLDVMIVTGRGLMDITSRIGIDGFTYVANHGFDIEGPGISLHHSDAEAFSGAVAEAADELQRLGVRGALVEPKGTTVSYHYRGVAGKDQGTARLRAERVLRRRKLRVTRGKLVVEGRPPVAWDKGTAVIWALTHRHGKDWPAQISAIYFGDDTTDEDAFRALRGLGKSIRVAAGADARPTEADYLVPDPDAVLTLIRWLASGAFAAPAD